MPQLNSLSFEIMMTYGMVHGKESGKSTREGERKRWKELTWLEERKSRSSILFYAEEGEEKSRRQFIKRKLMCFLHEYFTNI